jgi:crotonobetainyl-CoA:carnitine CoA-transferase CaiB-like acyl-CoA transferase
MIALLYREKSGRGQKVETSLLEGSVSWLLHNLIEYLATGSIPKRKQSSSPVIAPYQAIKAKDDYVIVAVGNEGQWKRFCDAIGAPELAEDPRFVTNKERTANRETLDEVLNGIFKKHTAVELIEWMSNAQVPCGPVSTIDRVVNDPQVQHLGLIQNVSHPDLPDLRLCGIPFKLSETPGAIQCPPPRLGEHTDQILNELGFSGGRITELRNKGVVE